MKRNGLRNATSIIVKKTRNTPYNIAARIKIETARETTTGNKKGARRIARG
jgi:hypothetical protein